MRGFYGWWVVGGTFVVLFTGFGCAYAFGTFFSALATEFDADRASVSLVFSIASLLYFLLGAIGGYLADRLGPRRVALAGIALLGGGLLLASGARTLQQVYLFYGLGVGLGVGFTYVPSVGTVQRWFVRRRGLASGFAVTGVGVGTLAVPLIAAALIEAVGWRGAFRVLGLGALCVGWAGAVLLVSEPARLGQQPDGAPAPHGGAPRVPPGPGLRAALPTRPFVCLYLAQLLSTFGMAIPFVHLMPYGEDGGLERTTAALCFALIGLGSTGGRFVLGGLADRFGRRRTMGVLFLALAGAYLTWLLPARAWLLGSFAVVFGTCYGGFVALLPAVIADYFAGAKLTTIIGVQYTAVAFGMFLGPLLAGYAYDRTASYALPMVAAAVLSLLAAVAVAAAPSRLAPARGAG